MNLKKICVQGFKSIVDQDFEPGQINVLIGANGSGKTALLEAIGMLSTAITGRVDDEKLQRKGVRSGTHWLYKSSFRGVDTNSIALSMVYKVDEPNAEWKYSVKLENPNSDLVWYRQEESLFHNNKQLIPLTITERRKINEQFIEAPGVISIPDDYVSKFFPIYQTFLTYSIYTPTTLALRDLITDIKPFWSGFPTGLCGNRLAEAITNLVDEENEKFGYLDLDEVLDTLDWIDHVAAGEANVNILSPNVPRLQKVIRFTDRFMREDNNVLTAYDASEGSLYVLFLLSMAMHPHAPRMFAIENFDQALHPNLARRAAKLFCDAIFANPSQPITFLTTHNPLVLDGLNILDERIRLFAIYRNNQGYTMINRVTVTEDLLKEGQQGLTLSRLWVMGRLGGVPNL